MDVQLSSYCHMNVCVCRDAGGSFGKMEAAKEEEYFRRMVRTQFVLPSSHVQTKYLDLVSFLFSYCCSKVTSYISWKNTCTMKLNTIRNKSNDILKLLTNSKRRWRNWTKMEIKFSICRVEVIMFENSYSGSWLAGSHVFKLLNCLILKMSWFFPRELSFFYLWKCDCAISFSISGSILRVNDS